MIHNTFVCVYYSLLRLLFLDWTRGPHGQRERMYRLYSSSLLHAAENGSSWGAAGTLPYNIHGKRRRLESLSPILFYRAAPSLSSADERSELLYTFFLFGPFFNIYKERKQRRLRYIQGGSESYLGWEKTTQKRSFRRYKFGSFYFFLFSTVSLFCRESLLRGYQLRRPSSRVQA